MATKIGYIIHIYIYIFAKYWNKWRITQINNCFHNFKFHALHVLLFMFVYMFHVLLRIFRYSEDITLKLSHKRYPELNRGVLENSVTRNSSFFFNTKSDTI